MIGLIAGTIIAATIVYDAFEQIKEATGNDALEVFETAMDNIMTIDTCNFAGRKAIVRVDFNVPLDENGNITDDTRIRGALPTLKKVLADGGALIIMSHMGKPKGQVNPKFSLGQIKEAVAAALNAPVTFAPDCAKAHPSKRRW